MISLFKKGDLVRTVEVPEGSYPSVLESLGKVGEIARPMDGGAYAVYHHHGCIVVNEDCLELVKGAN
ncbi:MAG: hypothetical protein WC375_08770 [Methanomassiliicoccales archaeon]|jgi:hypothetical protein